jgi:hypothetical protein
MMMDSARQTMRHVLFRHKLLRGPLVRRRHRDLTESDAFLASYPRSGTTWLRFLLYEALTGEQARFGMTRNAIPSIGKHRQARPVLSGDGRLIQTHEPFCDGDRRVVYVVRDARSVVSSEYRWQQRSGFFNGPFDVFLAMFLAGDSNPWGSWGDHVGFWLASEPARRGHLHVVRYEDLRRDTLEVFRAVLEFFGVSVSSDVIRDAIEHNSLASMRAKEDRAHQEGWRRSAKQDIRFIGSGSVGGWREALSPEQAAAIEQRFAGALSTLGYVDAAART